MNKKLIAIACLLLSHLTLCLTAAAAPGVTVTLQKGTQNHPLPMTGHPDTLTVRLTLVIAHTGAPPANLHFTLSDLDKSPFTQPVLLDSLPFRNETRIKRGNVTRTVRIVFAPLKCLANQENFSIIIAGTTDSAFAITIPATQVFVANNPNPTLAFVGDTSYLVPRIKGGATPEKQYITPEVELNGLPDVDMGPLDLAIPDFLMTTLPSKPTLDNDIPVTIPKKAFTAKGGCPVRIRIPLMIRLTPVDSPSARQLFYIQQKNNQKTVAVVIISPTNSATAAPAAAAVTAAKQLDTVYRFTFSCSKQNTFTEFTVLLATDSNGLTHTLRIIRPAKTNVLRRADTATYQLQNIFDASDLATWLVGRFPGLIAQDCANYLSFRIENELRTLTAKPQTAATVTTPPANATAPPALTPAANATPAASKSSPATDPATAKTGSPAPISLDNAITDIHPVYWKQDSSRILPIDLKLLRDSLPASLPDNDTVQFYLDKYTLPTPRNPKNPFALMSPQNSSGFIIPKKNWYQDTATKKFNAPVRLYFMNPPIDSISAIDRMGSIRIKNGDSSFHGLRLTERGMFNPSYPFWVDLGTNFDLLDGVQLNNLYSGIYGFVKDVARIGKPKNLSFTAGVYESKSVSTANTSDSGLIYRDGTSFIPDANGNYPYYRDTGTIKNTLSVTSMGIFFSPHLRLTNTATDDYGYHLFLSFYIEILWQRVTSSFDYSATGRAVTMTTSDPNVLDQIQFKEKSKEMDYRSHYLGVGAPMYIKQKVFTMYINWVVGVTNQKFVSISDTNWVHTGGYRTSPQNKDLPYATYLVNSNGFQQPKHDWNPFFLTQFRLTEEKYGISFTGEVRSILLRSSKPVISLSLSKKFDLSDLFNTLVKPFTPGTTGTTPE